MTRDELTAITAIILEVVTAVRAFDASGPSFPLVERIDEAIERGCVALGINEDNVEFVERVEEELSKRRVEPRYSARYRTDPGDVFAPVADLDLDGL